MKVKKEVTLDSIIYWIWGTEEEIRNYFRNATVIPSKTIIIHTFVTQQNIPQK